MAHIMCLIQSYLVLLLDVSTAVLLTSLTLLQQENNLFYLAGCEK